MVRGVGFKNGKIRKDISDLKFGGIVTFCDSSIMDCVIKEKKEIWHNKKGKKIVFKRIRSIDA